MAKDNEINWSAIRRLQKFFDEHAAKQNNPEARQAMTQIGTRFAELSDQVHNGSYGEVDGKKAALTAEEAMTYVLKPFETVGKIAKDKFNSAAGDAIDEARFVYNGEVIVSTLKQVHDQAEAAKRRVYPGIH